MRDILALELLSYALFNSAMPCTGMIGLSVSLHGISLHACARVSCTCVSVCVRARDSMRVACGCARFLWCSSVCYIYTCIDFFEIITIGAFSFAKVVY